MKFISTSLLSMQEFDADSKECEVKISNKKCTQNSHKTQRTQTTKKRKMKSLNNPQR
jgi:hypothetical protein